METFDCALAPVLAMTTLQWFLVAVLAAVILYLVYYITASKRGGKPADAPSRDLANLRIVDAREGDTVSIPGAGDDYDDLDFTVDRRDRYESGSERWFELSGMYRGRRVYVECYEADELEVSTKLKPTEVRLQDLGLEEADLIRMDEAQSRSEGFEYDGSRWDYERSREMEHFRGGTGSGEGFYGWEFREHGKDRILYVEKWEGEPFDVGIAKTVHPGDIRVYRSS